jgi:phosphatidylglycerophosphate synthase
MFDEPFRARLAPAIRPAARLLARGGVRANHLTIAAFVLAIGAAVLVATGQGVAGLLVWLVSRVGDGLDGALARETQSTPFGGFLDITLDMAAYTAMVLGFAWRHPDLSIAWAAVLAGYVLVITTTLALSDAARSAAQKVSQTDRTFQFTPGLAEAGETSVMYTLWVLFPAHVTWLVWVWVVALFVTSAQRTVLAWRVLR